MPELEHKGLQSALEEVRWLQGEDIIQALLGLVQQPITVHAPKQRIALENAARIALFQSEQSTCCVPNLRQLHLHAPQLTLVP